MPIAGLAGSAAQIPAGALIDAGKAKHGLVFAAAIVVSTACLTLQLFLHSGSLAQHRRWLVHPERCSRPPL
jgi:hypothetical protein